MSPRPSRRSSWQPVKPGTAVAVRPRAAVAKSETRQPPVFVHTYGEPNAEKILTSFEQYCTLAYGGNAVAFGLLNVDMRLFSEARLCWRNLKDKKLSYDAGDLSKLERPWPNGFTGELLARMKQDAGIAGNAYVRDCGYRLERLRPDWVTIVSWVTTDDHGHEVREVIGYMFEPDGDPEREPLWIPVEQMAHWAPIPDPLANWRGMSVLTPALRELNADLAMTTHREAYFRKAATPNIIIKYSGKITPSQKIGLAESIAAKHGGPDKAGGTLVLDEGADPMIVGAKFSDAEFSAVLSAVENRIAVSVGVPALLAGLKEGLDAAAWSMYRQALRAYADMKVRPEWRSACSSLSVLVDVPDGEELWYDTRDISALQESEKESADRMQITVSTIVSAIQGGFEWQSAVDAVSAGDETLLKHTGLVSVQLLPPGPQEPPPGEDPAVPEPDGPPEPPAATDEEDDDMNRALIEALSGQLLRSQQASDTVLDRLLGLVERRWTAENFDEGRVTRDGEGQFAGRAAKLIKALTDLAGDVLHVSGPTTEVVFPDREGEETGRFFRWEKDDEGDYSFEVGADYDEEPVRLTIGGQEFSHLMVQLAGMQLNKRKAALDPADRDSVLVHSVLTATESAAIYDRDDSSFYLDISDIMGDGEYGIDAKGPENAEAISFGMTEAEISQLQAAMALDRVKDTPPWTLDRARTRKEIFADLVQAGRVKRDGEGQFSRTGAIAKALLSGKDDALDGFNREQLRREARKRNIDLPRGASEDHIKDALWEHEREGVDDEADLPAAEKAELDLTRLKVPELREKAKAAGVKGYSKMRKADLVAALTTSSPSGDTIQLRDGSITREELNSHSGYLPLGTVPEPAARGDKVWTRRGVGIYLGPDRESDVGSVTYWIEGVDDRERFGGMFHANSIQTLNADGDGPAEDGDDWRDGKGDIPFPSGTSATKPSRREREQARDTENAGKATKARAAKTAGEIASEIEEMHSNGSGPSTMRERVHQRRLLAEQDKGRSGSPDVAIEMDDFAQGHDGNAKTLTEGLRAIADKHGAARIGGIGERMAFDPAEHEVAGDRPEDGAPVDIIRPGTRTPSGSVAQKALALNSEPDAPEARPVDASAVARAYLKLKKPNVEWVSLTDLRREMGGSHEDQDRALLAMAREGKIRLIPEENQKTITVEDKAAAINVSGEMKHLIGIFGSDGQAVSVPDWREGGPSSRFAKLTPERAQKGQADLQQAVEEIIAQQVSSGRTPQTGAATGDFGSDSNEWVRLPALRDALRAKGYTRDEQNTLLRDAGKDRKPGESSVQVGRFHYTGLIGEEDKRASLVLGGKEQHYAFLSEVPHGISAKEKAADEGRQRALRIASLERDLATVRPGSADHARFSALLAEVRGDAPDSSTTAEAFAARTPEQMIADPQEGDRELLRDFLRGMTLAELKKWAKDHGAELDYSGPKEQRIGRLVETTIGFRLNSRTIRNGGWDPGFVDVPGGPTLSTRHKISGDADEIARSLREANSHEGGHLWWTKDPEGLAKWATHEHPWTTLYRHVITWKGMTPEKAERITSDWYREVFGRTANEGLHLGPDGHYAKRSQDQPNETEGS